MDKAFIKGLTIMEILANSSTPRGSTEIARELGLTRSNVHRLIQTLVQQGFAVSEPATGRYKATLKFWELGGRVWSFHPLRRAVTPVIERLASETGETVHVLFRVGDDMLFVEQIGGRDPMRSHWPLGTRMSLFRIFDNGTGLLAYQKAFLATQPLQRQREIVDGFAAELGNPPKCKKQLLDEAIETQKRGAAINRGDWNAGLSGAAAIFTDAQGNEGIIGCAGSSQRLSPSRLEEVAHSVALAAKVVTRELTAGAEIGA